jgi:hypothetical protein
VQARGLVSRSDGRDDSSFELARATGVDQLPAESPQQSVRHRLQAHRAKAAKLSKCALEERIGCEPTKEGCVIGVERERESQLLEPGLAVSAKPDRPIWPLPGSCALEAAVDL